jgi:hypothetical protein
MRKLLAPILCLVIALLNSPLAARDLSRSNITPYRDGAIPDYPAADEDIATRYSSAAVDTYLIIWYDFEPSDWQGWTRRDLLAQIKTWFHADDFADITGGNIEPLQGAQSAWCGARQTDGPFEYLCTWKHAPGYGNGWDQSLLTGEIDFTGVLRLSYHGVFDTEEGWDYTYLEYDNGNGEWVSFHAWDGKVDTFATHEIPTARSRTKLRFHFISDGSYSDEDGLLNTNGACIIDSITIYDDSEPDSIIDYEDFEDWDLFATDNFADGDLWYADCDHGYGIYSGLMTDLEDKDPCGDNFGTQVVFFIGSEYPSSSYPGLFDTPFCAGQGGITYPCQYEAVISPIIDMTKYTTGRDEIQDAEIPAEDLSLLGGAKLRFTVYRDLPLANLVFYHWRVRNLEPATFCPGPWRDRGMPYYGPDKDYISGGWDDISDLVTANEPLQVSIGVADMCPLWYDTYGDCAEHTPSPWIDNVRVYRYKISGPQWGFGNYSLFQDNFPSEEYDLESWVRADMAMSINAYEYPYAHPGDSIVIDCTSPLADSLRSGGVTGTAEVYMHVRATDIGPFGKPSLYGPDLEGTYGAYVSDDSEWTIFQCDSAIDSWAGTIVEGRYVVDLNDSLFTRGYMIEYYFLAWDANNESSTLPKYAAEGQYFEFTCLPTGKSDILFVDDFHGRGTFEGNVETYWNPTFAAVIPPENEPDRYDVNSPSSLVSNGPGSRAFLNQLKRNEGLKSGYTIIVWDSGNLGFGTISDGSTTSDKSNDATMLINWLNQSENDVGLLVCGDDIAEDLNALTSTQSLELMSSWCGVEFSYGSYFELSGGRQTGGVVNPLITTPSSSVFGAELEFYIFGSCPIINQFDVLSATANGAVALWYPDCDGDSYSAGIQSVRDNAAGYSARTMWLGFSWMYIRDASVGGAVIRNELWNDVYLWFNGIPNSDITEDEVPKANKLSQNFPNPFNPTTTIKFDVRAKGHVKLQVYNVAGQLIKTMVDELMDAGSYSKEWNGVNNEGAKVASGVYFYRFEAGDFSATKKMVLLR